MKEIPEPDLYHADGLVVTTTKGKVTCNDEDQVGLVRRIPLLLHQSDLWLRRKDTADVNTLIAELEKARLGVGKLRPLADDLERVINQLQERRMHRNLRPAKRIPTSNR